MSKLKAFFGDQMILQKKKQPTTNGNTICLRIKTTNRTKSRLKESKKGEAKGCLPSPNTETAPFGSCFPLRVRGLESDGFLSEIQGKREYSSHRLVIFKRHSQKTQLLDETLISVTLYCKILPSYSYDQHIFCTLFR